MSDANYGRRLPAPLARPHRATDGADEVPLYPATVDGCDRRDPRWLQDARTGRSPFLGTVLRNPQKRIERLDEGLNATARIILLGLVMDTVHQIIVLKGFYPNEALIIALLLIRELVVRRRHDRASASR